MCRRQRDQGSFLYLESTFRNPHIHFLHQPGTKKIGGPENRARSFGEIGCQSSAERWFLRVLNKQGNRPSSWGCSVDCGFLSLSTPPLTSVSSASLANKAGAITVIKRLKKMAMRREGFMRGSLITLKTHGPQPRFESLSGTVRCGCQERNHTPEISPSRRWVIAD